MIVKGEQDKIKSCIESNLKLADYFAIAVDSGTDSDETYEICRSLLGPSEVFRHEWKDDFSEARNSALNHLLFQHPDTDYVYWIDSDDMWDKNLDLSIIKSRLESESPNAVKNIYVYGVHEQESSPNLMYYRTRFWKCTEGKSSRYWIGPAHEVNVWTKEYTGNISDVSWDDIILTHLKTGQEEHRTGRTQRNIRALKKGLKEEPSNSRYMFYLAREYKDANDFDNSIDTYKKYLPLSEFVNEKYQAMIDIAQIHKYKGELHDALHWSKEAWLIKPEIAEAATLIGEIYSLLGDWKSSKPWFAYALNAPHGEVLFDNVASRTYLPARWLSVSSYYTNDIEQAYFYHSIARKLAPSDLLTRSNEAWMFSDKYQYTPDYVNNQVLQAELFSSLITDENYPLKYTKNLALSSKFSTNDSVLNYSDDIRLLSVNGVSFDINNIFDASFISNTDLVSQSLLPLLDLNYRLRIILLSRSNNNYSIELLGSLISKLSYNGFLVIDNYQSGEIKFLISQLLRDFNYLSSVKIINYDSNQLFIIVKQ